MSERMETLRALMRQAVTCRSNATIARRVTARWSSPASTRVAMRTTALHHEADAIADDATLLARRIAFDRHPTAAMREIDDEARFILQVVRASLRP